MGDHAEREREARHRTALAMQRERVERTMESWDAVFACIDDELAAVRSAVLAEVDHEMHTRLAGAFRMGAEWTGLAYLTTGPEGFYAAIEEQVQRRYPNATQPALTALEATDGR